MPDGSVFRPDRVLTAQDRAKVIEYKTGQPHEAHKTQVSEYGKIIGQLGYNQVETYIFYLDQQEVQQID